MTKEELKYYSSIGRKWYRTTLFHFGTKGMHWGIQNGPPYPIKNNVRYKVPNMSKEEYTLACSYWNRIPEYPSLYGREKERVYEELDNNLTAEEKELSIVSRPIGDFVYTAINKGHNMYKIINKEFIDQSDYIVEEGVNIPNDSWDNEEGHIPNDKWD